MKSICKWPGGKTKLVRKLRQHMPADFGRYHEPFLGGGAMFFDGAAGIRTAKLADANPELINFYKILRNQCSRLLLELTKFAVNEAAYYGTRAMEPPDPVARAARFLYLNKTCFNGVYRVNSKGKFNTPWGKKPEGFVWYKQTELELASSMLHEATISYQDYEISCAEAVAGDFVYLDPPYDRAFDQYTTERFDQLRLRDTMVELTNRGVHMLASNSDTPYMRELYEPFWMTSFTVRQAVKPGTERKELLIANYIPAVES